MVTCRPPFKSLIHVYQESVTPGIIPDETKRFIADYVDSIVRLKALLFFREHRDRIWSSRETAERLYIREAEMAQVLARLQTDGFLAVEPGSTNQFRYHPASVELGRSLNQLAEVYAQYLVPITNLVHMKTRGNIGATALLWIDYGGPSLIRT